MKFVPYERKNLKRVYRPGPNQELLLEFANSGLDCAKIEGFTHKNAKICQSNLRTSAKRIGLGNTIKVTVRGEEVFLVRKNNQE